MGFSLTKVASIDLIFPAGPEGIFINAGNVILAAIAIAVPLLISLFIPKGIGRYGCILWGILAATIVAAFMGRIGIGVFYKIAVFFAVIPWAIYGGAMVIILGTIIFKVSFSPNMLYL